MAIMFSMQNAERGLRVCDTEAESDYLGGAESMHQGNDQKMGEEREGYAECLRLRSSLRSKGMPLC